MAVERFANYAQTTLTSPVAPTDTTITVASGAAFPSLPQFRVQVGTELMLVTGGLGGTTWNVTRAMEGTSAAGHSTGDNVTQVLTAGVATTFAAVGTANTFTTGTQAILTGGASTKGLVIQAAASQSANLQEWQDSSGAALSAIDSAGNCFVNAPTFALALGSPAQTGTNLTNILIVPRAGIIIKAFAAAKTGPTGADLIFDINKNGTSIWNATQANRLKIASGSTTGTQTSFDTTALAEGDQLTIDLDQVGSTIAGQDVTVTLLVLTRNQ